MAASSAREERGRWGGDGPLSQQSPRTHLPRITDVEPLRQETCRHDRVWQHAVVSCLAPAHARHVLPAPLRTPGGKRYHAEGRQRVCRPRDGRPQLSVPRYEFRERAAVANPIQAVARHAAAVVFTCSKVQHEGVSPRRISTRSTMSSPPPTLIPKHPRERRVYQRCCHSVKQGERRCDRRRVSRIRARVKDRGIGPSSDRRAAYRVCNEAEWPRSPCYLKRVDKEKARRGDAAEGLKAAAGVLSCEGRSQVLPRPLRICTSDGGNAVPRAQSSLCWSSGTHSQDNAVVAYAGEVIAC